MNRIIFFIVLAILLISCFDNNEDQLVASCNEKDLFVSDVVGNIPSKTTDSIYFADKFVDDWLRKQLMLSYAEMNLSADLLKYEKQIDDYRASLLIYAYQQELLNQNLDTIIDSLEIYNYYQTYKNKFRLSKNVFKGRFIVVDKMAPNIIALNKWYKSAGERATNFLEDYCHQFSKEYYLDINRWQYFSNINNRLPDKIEEEEYFLRNTKGLFLEDDTFRYYIFIKDYQIKGSVSPLSIEKEKIKDLILNKRKISYLKKLEDDLFNNALASKKIKIY